MIPVIWHRYIFLIGIIGLASGTLFGTAPTSIPQIILAANWILENNFAVKWQRLKSNAIFWVLISLYLLHLVGIFYTSDTQHGFDDLRNKLPLLILPIIFFSTEPLSQKEFKLLFYFFFLSVFTSSICCYLVYLGVTGKVIIDIRKASVFMSHIRFSLFIAFAIIGMGYFIFYEKINSIRTLLSLSLIWLLFFMFKLEMATGALCLCITLFILFIYYILNRFSKKIVAIIITLLAYLVVYIGFKVVSGLDMYEENKDLDSNTLLKATKSGRSYLHDTLYNLSENGTLIAININDVELEKEWNLKSNVFFNSLDKQGNPMRYTILRYLASLGVTKDSVGIHQLSQSDILNIENGINNYKYQTGLESKWRSLVWEYVKYRRGENPSGHSLIMRLEFWKTGLHIVKQHPVFGVGTGDVQHSFNESYNTNNSKLDEGWRLRCHNQYLAIAVAFGIIGLIIFLIYLFYPAISQRKNLHALYWPFFLIALLSFLTEDTLETQSGVTFFIFYQTLFLWLASFKKE